MKNLFKKTMLFAAAAMAFVSCANDTTDVNTLPGIDVTVNATVEGTKSHFGDYNATDKTYSTVWDGTEEWAVCLNATKVDAKEIEFSNGNTAASATVTFSEPEAYNSKYTLFAVSPLTSFVSVSMESDYIRFRVPGSQTPSTTSCDAAAQVLIAQSEASETISGFDVAFKHATAYGKFSFVNVAEGGTVTGVTIKSADVALAGRYVYAPSTKTISFKDEAVYEINLTTNTTTDLWFACGQAEVQGKKLTFIINTDKGKLEKEVTMPGNFVAGKVATFKVDMAGIEYPVVENVVEWHKVTSLAEITEGEYVIVHDEQTKGAMVLPNTVATSGGPTQTALSTKATVGDGILTNVDDGVKWIFTGTASAMKVQSYANNDNYLYVSGSDNKNIRVASSGSSTTWKFTESNGAFAMQDSKHSRFCGIYKDGTDWRSYNSATAGNYGTNSNGTNGAYLTLYKKFSTDPMISASNFDVPVVGGEGVATYSLKNIETDDVTGELNTEWLTVVAGGGEILWEAEPNYTGAARSAEVVLTSAGAGVSKTITVSQAADVFTVSATKILFGAGAGATAKFTVNSTYAFTLTNPDTDKLSLSATSGEGTVEITVTTLIANTLTEALTLGNIVVTRTADNKTKSVAVEQKAASTGGGDDTKYFVKVTSAPSDWSGTYLIVYETNKWAFDGSLTTLDAVSNYKAVTIADNQIEATDAMKAIAFTIAKSGTSYTIQSASGYYIGRTSNSNGFNSSETPQLTNTISISNGSAKIVSSAGPALQFNSDSNQTRFRYFKSTQKAIQLYKLN